MEALKNTPTQNIVIKPRPTLNIDGILSLKITAKLTPLTKRTKIKYCDFSRRISSKTDSPNNKPAAYIRKIGSSLIINIIKNRTSRLAYDCNC